MSTAIGHRRLWRNAQLTVAEAQTVLASTAAMRTAASTHNQVLRGRQVALLSATPCANDETFSRAVQDAGGRVALLRANAWHGNNAQLAEMARLLGSMYDAVDCCDLPADAIRDIEQHAQLPVFDGLAHPNHPLQLLAAIATALQWQEQLPLADKHAPRIALAGISQLPAQHLPGVQWTTRQTEIEFVLEPSNASRGGRLLAVGATPLDQARLSALLAQNQRALVQAALACVLG